ncbi:hypothetical protein FYC62_11585 [Pedobacter aquae]|uniref:NAD-dependent epimerase/dehydratase family protein n=1 Tax=Pedobacter aquae TaxID=2605747 RepID=A0A5C0VMI4_9SPHI|nr:hypothetical protein [Pedobacter aquae]QEK52204.1 hypothetical protein FYC62_11585 [Pedobacter aquae]
MKLTITGTFGLNGQNLIPYLADYEICKLSLRDVPNQEIYLDSTEATIHLAAKAYDLKNV